MDTLIDWFGQWQDGLFEALVQPLMFHIGLGNRLEDAYNATGWLLIGLAQLAVMLALIEPLRTLRLIHYSAWLAQRCDDPAFVQNFPWFGSSDYWAEQTHTLQEQCEVLCEPPLMV